jgi:hypothetical protein
MHFETLHLLGNIWQNVWWWLANIPLLIAIKLSIPFYCWLDTLKVTWPWGISNQMPSLSLQTWKLSNQRFPFLQTWKLSNRRHLLSPGMKTIRSEASYLTRHENYLIRGIFSHQTWKLSDQRLSLSSDLKIIQSEASSLIRHENYPIRGFISHQT